MDELAQQQASTLRFKREVADRFGVLPNFFCSADAAPGLVEELWKFAKSAYLDSPLPSVFKERLFVHLSRFCEIRYCIVRHVGFLIGQGRPAGDATNVVTDYVHVRGESRSHDSKFFKEITKAYKVAFEKAAKRVKNSDGKSGRVKFKAETDYYPFRMKDSLPVVKKAVAAVSRIGATPTIRAANGGLDANWMVRHGVPTVTFGAGQNEPHTIDEWINLDEYDRACALAVQLATMR